MFQELTQKIKDKKVILFGELHGTKETPQIILDFLKSLDYDFEVCLEIPQEFNENLEEFYNEDFSDARNSKEYFDFIKEIKKMNKNVIFIDSFAKNQEEKESNLAKNIINNLANKKIFAILGEIHASKDKIIFQDNEIIPAGYLLNEKLKDDLFCARVKPSKGKYFNFGVKEIQDQNDSFDKSFDYCLNIGQVSPCSFRN